MQGEIAESSQRNLLKKNTQRLCVLCVFAVKMAIMDEHRVCDEASKDDFVILETGEKIMTQCRAKAFFPLLLSAVLLAGGCTTYYQIQDPESGHVYYADDLKTLDGGAVRFIDAHTGNEVTVQDSDIKEIPEDEFNIRRYEQVPAPEPTEEAK